MRKSSEQSVTSLPPSPDDDRRARFRRYTIAMVVRLACFILCFFVQGWWLILPVLAALILPYVAVVLANTGSGKSGAPVIAPGSLALPAPSADRTDGTEPR
jgi:predicted tellurium resistance membrane protein TerC